MGSNEIRSVGRQGVHARLRRAMGARRTVDYVATRSIACGKGRLRPSTRAMPMRFGVGGRGTAWANAPDRSGQLAAAAGAFSHPTRVIGNSDWCIDKPFLTFSLAPGSYALLQGEIASLGLLVPAGFRHILEIARQSVPEGYGNSYFWVKPERLVPLDLVREVGGRLDFCGQELRPLAEADVRAAAEVFRRR